MMRITGNKPINGVQGRGGKKNAPSGTEQFAPDLGGEVVQSSQTAGGAAIQGMDALLALQEVDERAERRSKAARYGHTLLDALESVRVDLLAGQVSEDRLEVLAQQVANRPPSGDSKIDSVLEEIELRVKVELAKLGRFSDQ
ncbi:MAG: flagellar assembly protein FliX [Pseudomonadota bacterium]